MSTLLALVLGATAVLAFAPFGLAPLGPLSLALLFTLWRRAAAPRQAAWLGWLWGLAFFLGGVSWVYVSLHDVGEMPAPIAAAATLAFCACLALYPALAGWFSARLASGRTWPDVLLFAGVWCASEWLRGVLFTGFPWLSLGYSQAPPSPLAGFAPVLGVYGLGYLAAFLAAALALLRWRAILPVACVLLAGLALQRQTWTEPLGAPLTVSLLQGNVEQSIKWEPPYIADSLDTYARLARAHPADLIVLPETALPMFLHEVPSDYLDGLMHSGPLLVGVVLSPRHDEYLNAAVALTPGAAPAAYAKSHLVPFGEFMPPGFSWFLALMRIAMSDFSPGASWQEPLALAGQRIAPNICYEDLFGEEIIRALPQATLLVNLSNTAWFGNSLAQPQHLQVAQLRALESGRMMLRATNTGMTAVLRTDGSVQAVLPPFSRAVLTAQVQGYTGATPYVRWGNASVLLIAALSVLLAPCLSWRRRRAAMAHRDEAESR